MSGYKDSAYWASDDEIAAHRERQQQASESASEPASQPAPVYISHLDYQEGARVLVDVQAFTPRKIDGWDV